MSIFLPLIIFFSGFVHALTGFGFALIATPLLFLVMDPKSVIVIVNLLGIITMLVLTTVYRKKINIRRTVFIFSGCLLGIPLGAYLLSIFTATVIKLVVAIMIIIIATLLIPNRTFNFRKDISWHLLTGFIGGILSTSTSLGGPPVVLFLLSQRLEKSECIGTISAVGLITCIATIITFGSMGIINTELVKMGAISLPAMGLGLLAGINIVSRIDDKLFRKVALAVVILSALAVLLTILYSS